MSKFGQIVRERDCLIGQMAKTIPDTFSQERWRWAAAIGAISCASSMTANLQFIKNMPVNIWFMGIGRTGTGKSESFGPVEWLLGQAKDLPRLTGNATKAALLDRLEQSFFENKSKGYPAKLLRAYQIVWNDEWTDVMPQPDQQLLSTLIKCWGDQEETGEYRRHSKRTADYEIPRPTVTIVGGVQPEKFKVIFPESSAAEGFARRTLFSFEQPKPKEERNLLLDQVNGSLVAQEKTILKPFVPVIKTLFKSWINIQPDESAALVYGAFRDNGSAPMIDHLRARDWNTTREQYMAKIAGLFAISRHFADPDTHKKEVCGKTIYLNGEDMAAGIDFILWCEETFLEFYETQIEQSFESMWAGLTQFCLRPKTEQEILHWFSSRVPSWQIKQMFVTAKETGRIRKLPSTESVSIGTKKDRYQTSLGTKKSLSESKKPALVKTPKPKEKPNVTAPRSTRKETQPVETKPRAKPARGSDGDIPPPPSRKKSPVV